MTIIKPRVDFTGRKINGWEVLSLAESGDSKASLWNVRHKCGEERVMKIANLRTNGKKLCGCRFKKPLAEEIKDMQKKNGKKQKSQQVGDGVWMGGSMKVPKPFHQNTNPDRQRTVSGEEIEKKRMEHFEMSAREYGRLQAYNYAGVLYRP